MLFRFTLTHDVLGSKIISECDGWKECKLKLERDKNFKSLIEYFDGSFIFYGKNGNVDGGIDFIKECELLYGFDTLIRITIELSIDGYTYQDLFEGQLNLAGAVEMLDNKIQIPIIRDDFWSKFINRLDTPVDVQSPVSLDGDSIDVIAKADLALPSQKIRYNGNYVQTESSFTFTDLGTSLPFYTGCQLNWDTTIIDDIQKFSIELTSRPNGVNDENMIGIIEAPFDGFYSIDVRLVSAVFVPATPSYSSNSSDFFIRSRKIGSSIYIDGVNSVETVGLNSYLISELTTSFQMLKGEQLAIYGLNINNNRTVFGSRRLNWVTFVDLITTITITLFGEQIIDGVLTSVSDVLVRMQGNPEENGIYTTSAGAWIRRSDSNSALELNNSAVQVISGDTGIGTFWRQIYIVVTLGVDPINYIETRGGIERILPYDGSPVDNHLIISSDTTFKDTTSESFLLHDVGAMITDRIISQNDTFYSELLGRTNTFARQYDTNGCDSLYMLTKGLQIRQYSLIEKPFFLSFNQWWKGINPILCLGLGYEVIDGNQVIRIERMEHFYDASSVSVQISNVRQITRKYDQSVIFKTVKVGYNQWQSEDISGIDDPQTKHTYATIFSKTGEELTIESDFIAASLAIESARRTTRVKSSDYKLDNNTFIISVRETDVLTSPDIQDYTPELDENFTSITNLLNPETRYNSRITPARNLIRWIRFISGSLQSYLTSKFKFVSGEGNYDMTSVLNDGSNGCDEYNSNLSEKQDIDVSNDPLHLAMLYEIVIPLDWEDYVLIRDNRKKAIEISQTDTGHIKFFIETLEYQLVKSQATISAWPVDYMDIQTLESSAFMVTCEPVGSCEDAYLTEDNLEYITEDGNCLILN